MLDKILGFIANTLNYEVVPVTLTNGYTLASWGYIKAYRFGYICMLTFSGLKRSTATTSNTQFASIPFTVMENMTTSAIDGGSDTAIVQAMKGTSEIYINAANANANYFGQLIFIVGGVLLNPHFSTFTAILQKIGGGLDVGQDTFVYCKQTERCTDLLRPQRNESERQEKGRFGLHKLRNRCSVRSRERTVHRFSVWWKHGSAVLHPIQLRSHLDKILERFNLEQLGEELTISDRGWEIC